MIRTESDFEKMPTLELYEEVLELSQGDLWDGLHSKKHGAERDAARNVLDKRMKHIDELEATLTDLLIAVPKETVDADWWPDNLRKAYDRAKQFA